MSRGEDYPGEVSAVHRLVRAELKADAAQSDFFSSCARVFGALEEPPEDLYGKFGPDTPGQRMLSWATCQQLARVIKARRPKPT